MTTKMKIKNISNKLKIALVSVFLVGQTSCTDFLEENAPSNLTPESFYTIPDHAEAALASVYADMRFMGGGAGIFSSNWQLLEAMTGTSTTETAQNSDLNNFRFSFTPFTSTLVKAQSHTYTSASHPGIPY